MQVAVEEAGSRIKSVQIRVKDTLKNVQITRDTTPWMRSAIPEMHQWMSDLQKKQKHLKKLQGIDYKKIISLKDSNDYGFFSEHPISLALATFTGEINNLEIVNA
jgi:hypothetical protein